ncbi:MAG: DUF1385 domain-containing protein [Peptococcaceae bacterium]|nr:DUF1385 domain-containing protein [Peptococcaceae bacterium]
MMRGTREYCIALRLPDGSIELTRKPLSAWPKKKICRIPLVRGCVALIDSLVVGMKAITYSAERAMDGIDEETETPEGAHGETPGETHKNADGETVKEAHGETAEETRGETAEETHGETAEEAHGETAEETPAKKTKIMENIFMALALVLGMGIAIVLVVILPVGGAHLLQGIPAFSGTLVQNLIEALFRLIILFLYMLAISRMKDIQRVFAYHGAEHKVIFTHEDKVPLTVEEAQKRVRFHPRCGTSFLLMVAIVSIFVFVFLGLEPWWWRFLSRLLFLPVVAGIAYEILKFSGRHMDSPWLSWLVAPGLWLQKLTTQEPDEQQLEVAIAALNGVLESGQELEGRDL